MYWGTPKPTDEEVIHNPEKKRGMICIKNELKGYPASYLSRKFLISHTMMMIRCTRKEIQKLIGIERMVRGK
jgi:hypothetical protein